MATGAYVHALEIDVDNSWAGEVGSRSARSSQVMNAESLGTYHRPVQVYKYMHLHEYMQGRSHVGSATPGTLGSGAVAVRDKMRSLHLPKTIDGEGEKRSGTHDTAGMKDRDGEIERLRGSKRRTRQQGGAAGASAGASSGAFGPDDEFVNKGYYVWEAVRREWRGTTEAAAAARAQREASGADRLELYDIEAEFEDSSSDTFSRPVPLSELIQMFDELWEGEHTL